METNNPFEKVLDRLREKGWRQGWFGDENGPNCIYGAAQHLGDSVPHLIDNTVVATVKEHYPDRTNARYHSGVAFNDHPDTTFTDVERVLEKAAVKWEEERVLRDD